MSATISNEVQAEARRLLREQITRSAWFRNGMSARERQDRIEQEVDAWWHLKTEEATKQLEEHISEPLKRAS